MTTAAALAGTLITVAPTGAETAKADVPQLPTTLDELVETAVRCEAAGAALIHLHVRDAEHRPTLDAGPAARRGRRRARGDRPGRPAVDRRRGRTTRSSSGSPCSTPSPTRAR